MLLDTHKRYHELGPKDFFWPVVSWLKNLFIKNEGPITFVAIEKNVSEGERWTVQVPIYRHDTRQIATDRCNMFASIAQDRMDDFAKAWQLVQDAAEAENKQKKSNTPLKRLDN